MNNQFCNHLGKRLWQFGKDCAYVNGGKRMNLMDTWEIRLIRLSNNLAIEIIGL